MDPVTIAIIIGLGATTIAIIKVYALFREKNKEIDALLGTISTYAATYSFEKCDEEIITHVRQYLHQAFQDDYSMGFEYLTTIEEKKTLLQNVAFDLAQTMGIKLNNIDIMPIDQYTLGYTDEDGLSVVINEALLVVDPEQAIRTLCHELRHCMQFQAIQENKWGFSAQRIAEWILSIQQYEQSNDFYSAYRVTIIEVDARNFAEQVV